MKTRTGYSGLQILLHWATALLVVFNWFYSDGMGRALRVHLDGVASTRPSSMNPDIHVWTGLAVLGLVLLRLALRAVQGTPPAVGDGWMRAAATWGHRLLYALLLATPLLGAAAWFGGVKALGDPHELAANALLWLAGAHAAVALWHHYVLHDRVLARMVRPE
ncbi:Cytochrome b562 [Xylophilus ampelinus]|nr:cytochrome b/b6 domain-containing protein [Variovorax sp.]VTY38348.1 Cytochrome b562 [Xylophilus ampelinus]